MTKCTEQKIRTLRFRPYRAGMGPTFTLTMWGAGTKDYRGVTTIHYRLSMRDNGRTSVLFEASDYHGSIMHADDSDANVVGLMGFLTLSPGDTADDYFANYTPDQLEYCEQHAEALSFEVYNRLGEGEMRAHRRVRPK